MYDYSVKCTIILIYIFKLGGILNLADGPSGTKVWQTRKHIPLSVIMPMRDEPMSLHIYCYNIYLIAGRSITAANESNGCLQLFGS